MIYFTRKGILYLTPLDCLDCALNDSAAASFKVYYIYVFLTGFSPSSKHIFKLTLMID